MFLYSLTPEEVTTLSAVNSGQVNVILVVCCHGEYTGVDPVALQAPEFANYLNALGSYDANRIIEIEDVSPFGI